MLVVVDALRADHVGAYGYPRDTTPVIDALAEGGLRFERAISQGSWTLPSMMSLFTSRDRPDLPPARDDIRRVFALDEAEETLAERLRDAGYRTISVTTNPYNVDAVFRLMQGFDAKHYSLSASASWVVDRAIEELDAPPAEAASAPFFLYLHLMDVHAPYRPPSPYDRMFAAGGRPPDPSAARPVGATGPDELAQPDSRARLEASVALYDGALRYADAQLGRLLDHLAARGLRDATVIAVASDHGEAFWDSVPLEASLGLHAQGQPNRFGVEHGRTLFQEIVHVPLILNGPGVAPGVASQPVRNLDIGVTLLGLAGLTDSGSDGVDLLGGGAPRPALSETRQGGPRQASLVTARRQIVRVEGTELAFDSTRPDWPRVEPTAELSRELDAALGSVRRARFREGYLDGGTLEALRALGYVE